MTASDTRSTDDALALPLTGTRLVEASAGTGKTFTIATLYLRLILEQNLGVDAIVVATFTRAAAAELSERLGRRLQLACDLLGGASRTDADTGESRETQRVIEQATTGEITRAELARRAQAACFALDTALIGTLHGFCHRALAEFGFSAGLGLEQAELVDDVRALKDEIVRDFWRGGSADAATAARLTAAWGTPDELARHVREPRWREREIDALPPATVEADALERVEAARTAIAGWNAETLARARAEIGRAIGNGNARNARLRKFDAICTAARIGDNVRVFIREAGKFVADFAPALLAEKSWFKGPFAGDELPVVQDLTAAIAAIDAGIASAAARLLRDAREYLEAELPRRLNERNLMSHDTAIDRLDAALASPRGDALAARLGQRWKAALIDEFQDTDAAQWRIVRRLFGKGTLILVGDPKQAIYGFRGGDVYAWRAATEWAKTQQGTGASLRLSRSYRAGDGMCRAINALFSRPAVDPGAGAFIEPIAHPDLESAEPVRERALLRDGKPMAALQLWWLDPEQVGHARNSSVPSKPYVYAAVERACVAWIGNMLADPAITLRRKRDDATRLQPQHVAVLVNSNDEAFSMQAALARAGIAAACNLQASVFRSDEADDLALLLAAAANSDDLASARAARASILLGNSAAAITATRGDDRAQSALLEEVAGWAARLARHGPVAWLLPLLEAAAPRLLALADGRRRVANYLQLIELLQGLNAQSFGNGDLALRFARARVEAADGADAERLRLDTDADAVTVSTIHTAKGLEYGVVLLPYAVLGHRPGTTDAVPLHWYHDAAGAARVAIGKGTDRAIRDRAGREAEAEDVRKFYVAVTRAAALCVLPYGPTSATGYSAAHHLLQVAGRAQPLDDCRQALEELTARAGDATELVEELPHAQRHAHVRNPKHADTLYARSFKRAGLERDWQVWSFSRLVRGSPNDAEPDPAPGAGDAGEVTPAPHVGLAGPRFGTAVHAVFEGTDFAAWRGATTRPESERALIDASLRAQGLPDRGIGMDAAVREVADCVRGALNAQLPCGMRLCELAPADRRAEIEFHFALAPADTGKLYALLHRFHYQEHRAGVAPARLAGLMTGKIDLTFRHAGRFHIIDWKTNLCAAYDDATLTAEIARHDYDLQWLIYTLALHRWLRQRLAGYDYARDVGEAYYLFVRGMANGAGVHTARPPAELIAALDQLFAGGAP
ncbi:MAG TPA: UvrD-helicase domain-containing protein [Rhodanobacteraceae bacterium]